LKEIKFILARERVSHPGSLNEFKPGTKFTYFNYNIKKNGENKPVAEYLDFTMEKIRKDKTLELTSRKIASDFQLISENEFGIVLDRNEEEVILLDLCKKLKIDNFLR
jgi:hypothetical protein